MNASIQFAIKLTVLGTILTLAGCLDSGGDSSLVSNNEPPAPPPPPPPVENRAPTISGVPNSSVIVDEQYSFAPSAMDADNDPLTFSVQGEPDWLTIESDTGILSGIPALADIGSYSGIVISVSDGSLSASLPQFVVDVVQNADGSVSLSWTAPTLNEDGTALTDLAGYKIYYGTSSGNYTVEIPVDLGTTTLMVDNLTPDTYYFAATSVNTSDIESRFSGEAIKTVN
jgi:hypothetical protein